MSIEFVQYSLPYGRKTKTPFFAKPEIEKQAADLIEKGCEFTFEILRTGVKSITCEKGSNLLAIEFIFNAYDMSAAIERLVLAAVESFKKAA